MSEIRAVAVETLLVALVAVTLALAANALSPRGLRLGRDYFPRAKPQRTTGSSPADAARTAAAPDAAEHGPDQGDAVAQRIARQGLALAAQEDVVQWFRDPQYAQGLFVFVDARDDAAYRAGHIPGAWQFNHYRPDAYLPAVLPACLAASKVVVYCAGGDCEDSEFAALMLRDAGVARENLFVYAGGIAGWSESKLPLETGARGSGQLAPISR